MYDPALLAAAMLTVDAAISSLMRARVALEEAEWAQRQNAPELHEEAQGRGYTPKYVPPWLAATA